MRTFSNFAVSFTIISILSGCLTLFAFAMNTGGPAVMTLGWLFVGFFVMLVALGHGRGGLELPDGRRPLLLGGQARAASRAATAPQWSWFVGWFNLVGQVAVTAGIDFGLALFTTAFLNLAVRLPGRRRRARSPIYGDRPDPPRPAEHVRDPARRAAQRRVGVVAPRRRRRRSSSSASS